MSQTFTTILGARGLLSLTAVLLAIGCDEPAYDCRRTAECPRSKIDSGVDASAAGTPKEAGAGGAPRDPEPIQTGDSGLAAEARDAAGSGPPGFVAPDVIVLQPSSEVDAGNSTELRDANTQHPESMDSSDVVAADASVDAGSGSEPLGDRDAAVTPVQPPSPLPEAECDAVDDLGCSPGSYCGFTEQELDGFWYRVPTCIEGEGRAAGESCADEYLSCGSGLRCSGLENRCRPWCTQSDLTRCAAGDACDTPYPETEWGACYTPCDVWEDTCPSGEACYPKWITREGYCDEAGSQPIGEQCAGQYCEPGAGCIFETCKQYCRPGVMGDCPTSMVCAAVSDELGYCDVPCDPLSAQGCSTGEACVVASNNESVCIPAGITTHGDSCRSACAARHQCFQHTTGDGECHALCDLEDAASCAAYPGTECADVGHERVGACAVRLSED